MFVPHHSCKSRHGIFYFRFVVPRDLRAVFGTGEIKRSLDTRDPAEARIRAQLLSLRMQIYVSRVRSLMAYDPKHFDPANPASWPSDKKDLRDLTAKISTPYGVMELVDIDSKNPADVALFDKALERLEKFNHSLPAVSPPNPAPYATVQGFPPGTDVSMSSLIQTYLEEKRRLWPVNTFIEFQEYFNVFLEAMGDRAIALVDRAMMSEYKHKFLMMLPPNRKKQRLYRDRTLKEIVAMQRKLPAEQLKCISPKTVECYMSCISSFLNWCVDNGKLANNPAVGLCAPKGRSARTASNPRHPYNVSELKAIFDAERFKALKEAHYFWVPLMALFSGARLNEICGLTVDDIRKVPDVDGKHLNLWEMHINEDAEDESGSVRHVKNQNACRRVPLHPELLRIGLLDYVEDIKQEKHRMLFPNLSKGRRGLGRKVSYWFSNYLKELHLKTPGKVFHSLRHTVISTLHQRGVREYDYRLIVGHDNASSSSPYINDYDLTHTFDNAYGKFYFEGLDLAQIKYDKAQFSRSAGRSGSNK